jgi:hypothetical protein
MTNDTLHKERSIKVVTLFAPFIVANSVKTFQIITSTNLPFEAIFELAFERYLKTTNLCERETEF